MNALCCAVPLDFKTLLMRFRSLSRMLCRSCRAPGVVVRICARLAAESCGRFCPSNWMVFWGVSPTHTGWVWMVPRHGAVYLAIAEGSISPESEAPETSSTFSASVWMGVSVASWKKQVFGITLESMPHGPAARYGVPPIMSGTGLKLGLVGWPTSANVTGMGGL